MKTVTGTKNSKGGKWKGRIKSRYGWITMYGMEVQTKNGKMEGVGTPRNGNAQAAR